VIAGIFLLLLMAALAALVATITTAQHASSAQDLMGSRAYQAARAGLEWGVYQALISSSCLGNSPALALEDNLAQFTVLVQCTQTIPIPTEGGANVNVYRIISTATSGTLGSPNYVERRLEVTVS
jgi:MSHA biogenesis protein MshP